MLSPHVNTEKRARHSPFVSLVCGRIKRNLAISTSTIFANGAKSL
jgi:hypothetical protein